MAAGMPGGVAPKQFLSIGGVPMLVHSLRAFLAVPRVEAIYVAVRGREMERVAAQVAEFGLGPRRCMWWRAGKPAGVGEPMRWRRLMCGRRCGAGA